MFVKINDESSLKKIKLIISNCVRIIDYLTTIYYEFYVNDRQGSRKFYRTILEYAKCQKNTKSDLIILSRIKLDFIVDSLKLKALSFSNKLYENHKSYLIRFWFIQYYNFIEIRLTQYYTNIFNAF